MANEIKDYPKILYKYYPPNKHGLEVLKDEVIYASHAYDFNDPFDGTPLFWENLDFPSREAVEKLFEKFDIADVQKHLRSVKSPDQLKNYFFRRMLDTYGIYCLNDGRLQEYQLQEDIFWGYYNNHKGFRLEFNTEFLSDLWKIKPLKVNHLEISELLNQRLILEKKDLLNDTLFRKKVTKWLTSKKIVWKQENEWRFLFEVNPFQTDQTAARKQKIDLKAIKSITLGFSFLKGNELLFDNGVLFKYRFKLNDKSNVNDFNYSFEILRYLYENSHIPLYQVALTNKLELYSQKIKIIDIYDHIAVIQRFSPEY